MKGRLKGTQDGGTALWASDRDTLVVTGFVAHRIEAITPSRVLVGSEPYKHLDWLSRNLTMICVPDSEHEPLVYRLHLVIALIIDEISNPEFQPLCHYLAVDRPVSASSTSLVAQEAWTRTEISRWRRAFATAALAESLAE